MTSLQAISPIDGRYHQKTKSLIPFFSEEALIRYRVMVEVEYFLALCEEGLVQLRSLEKVEAQNLRKLYLDFRSEDAVRIKEIEGVTNHDVKAVEYWLKEKFENLGLGRYREFIHFGLSSQDINNTAIPLSIREAMDQVYLPCLDSLLQKLVDLENQWQEVSMLARTHGQPASPTRLGKEIGVFAERIREQKKFLKTIPFAAKFGGATGNFNAHKIAYPDIDWKGFATRYVQDRLGLHHSFPTTQIEHYDHLASLFDALKRINNIILDLDRDIWTYISMDYFKQRIKKGEIGSSAMPHKVNPIDFENSEGNLGIANALFEHLAAKLPLSRLQRDLTDSTVLRCIGVPFGHSLIAIEATLKGLDKLLLNQSRLEEDLERNWAVVAEAIQTILRREGYPNPYEALKQLTRTNTVIDRKAISAFIEELAVSEETKKELRSITPQNYTGI